MPETGCLPLPGLGPGSLESAWAPGGMSRIQRMLSGFHGVTRKVRNEAGMRMEKEGP